MIARGLRLAVGCALLAGAVPVAAEDGPVVVITPGESRAYQVALRRFADVTDALQGKSDPQRAARLRDMLAEALEFSSVFGVIDPKAFLAEEQSPPGDERIVCFDWTQTGADVLVDGSFRTEFGTLEVEVRVWDTARCKRIERKTYRAPVSRERKLAERVADDVVALFTGTPGVASTELAFVSDRGGNDEVYVMGAVGRDVRPATRNRSINKFPDWSPDGGSILYTSYKHQRRPSLFVVTRDDERAGRILGDLDSGAAQYRGVYSPSGQRVAVVMSVSGSPDIFTVRPNGRGLRRLTDHRAIDVSPTWSPDGKRIAFVSDRSGAPQVYVMDANGKHLRRLTYEGSYNTAPAWSPDGRWIAYEARLEGQLDIWLIDPEATANFPLISHPRSDEQPSWAPNGKKLAFSSTRRGNADIYVVDVNGENLRRLTHGEGRNTGPSWGPFPR